MRRYKIFIYLAILAFGVLALSINEWLKPMSAVDITNASNINIKFIDILFRGEGVEQEAQIGHNLKPSERTVFKWPTVNEGSYRFKVHFENGTEVVGGAGYVERGETIRDVIGAKGVMSARQMLPYLPFYSDPRDSTYTDKPNPRFRPGNSGWPKHLGGLPRRERC